MADDSASPWGKMLEQISSPWDWVAGGAGAAAGAGVSIAMGGADLGASIAAGFTGGIAARKAIHASLTGKRLRNRANGLLHEIKKHENKQSLLDKLEREIGLWESKAITHEQFSESLDRLIDEYRQSF